MRPLDGLFVLDLTRLMPGAVATMFLADFGAEVIKVEQPGSGDPARSLGGDGWLFRYTNRGKKSIAINLKDPRGKTLLLSLVKAADVLIESFRPGVMQRLGLDYNELSAANNRLIYVSLTSHGQNDVRSAIAGHDLNYLAETGVIDLITPKGGPPNVPEIQLADLAAGSSQAIMGILLALEARHRTSRGQMVDVAMVGGMASLLTLPLAAAFERGRSLDRGNELLSGRYACYNVYQACDGQWLAIGALEQRFWSNLCRELQCEHLICDQFAPEPRQSELKTCVAAIIATKTADEWALFFDEKDCCVTRVRTLSEALGEGEFRPCENLFPGLSNTPAMAGQGVPALGEHSVEILERAGYSPAEMERLQAEGLIQ